MSELKVGKPILERNLTIKGVAFEGVYQDPETPGYAHGACQIAGCDFHALFVRVKAKAHRTHGQMAVNDPWNHYETLEKLNPGPYQTLDIPGFDGEWVMVLYPFAS